MAERNKTTKASGNPGDDEKTQQPEGTEQPREVEPIQTSEEIHKDARQWAMFCHLAGLAGLLPIVPFIGGVIGPLVIWQIKKDDFPFVDEQGKEAVNFQISIVIYEAIAGILCLACIGFFLLPAVIIFDVVFLLIAAVKANNGYHYRYPLCIRFIK